MRISRQPRIAIILANDWRGGMLRNARVLAGLLAGRSWPGRGSLEVVVGVLSRGAYDWAELRRDVGRLGPTVSVRRFAWDRRSVAGLRAIFGPLLDTVPAAVTSCSVPRDGGHDFLDCDAWIVFSSSLEGFIAPLRPLAIYCADLIQRYVPEVFAGREEEDVWACQLETHLGWRRAHCVFATTPQTRSDAVSYAGVRGDRALLVPTLVEPTDDSLSLRSQNESEPYILWITNSSAHKNHTIAMQALRAFYGEFGGTLPVVVAGADTNSLAPGSDGNSVAHRVVRAATDVLPHMRFAGEVTNTEYLHLVSRAAVVWHNVIIDNGTFVAFDAARAGRHLVSSDYPQMRYLCQRYGVEALWHPAGDPRAAAAALLEAGRRAAAGRDPGHAWRQDPESEIHAAYGAMMDRLFDVADA